MRHFEKRELAPANADATAAMELFARYPREQPGWIELCEGLAELMQLADRPDDCDRLCQRALAARPASGVDRGDLEFFYAKFLLGQQRLDEAEMHAIEAIRAPCGEVGFAQAMLREIRAAKASR